MLLRLPARLGAIVGVLRFQMGMAGVILDEAQILELRHRHFERFADFFQTGRAGAFRCFGNTLQKCLAEWVIFQHTPAEVVGKLQQLRHQVQIGNRAKKIREHTKAGIGGNLFQAGLCQQHGIHPVLRVRAREEFFAFLPDLLSGYQNALQPPGLALETQNIAPVGDSITIGRFCQLHVNTHLRIVAGVQATQLADAAPGENSRLQSAAGRLAHIAQKAEHIQ